jgi:hypothetical protein
MCCALAGCGATAGLSTRTPSAQATRAATRSNPLLALFPQGNEMPGFTASGAPRTSHTIAQSVSKETSGAAADAAHLRADGFQEAVDEPLTGTDGQANAIAFVARFTSTANAAKYEAYLYGTVSRPGPETGSANQTSFTHFAVPGVAGALGSSVVTELEHGVAANVQWTEGDCTIELGDATSAVSHPLSAPLISAAQAIFARTHGSCG